MSAEIYDVADDPLFGRPSCVFFKDELCVADCEFGIAGDCPRRLAEEDARDGRSQPGEPT